MLRQVFIAGLGLSLWLGGAPQPESRPSPLAMSQTLAAPSESEARAQLDAIGERIEQANRRLEATDTVRDNTSDELEAIETQLAETNQQLDGIQAERRQLSEDIAELERRRQLMEDERDAQREALGRQLNALYRLGRTPQLKLLLNQDDPARLDRLQSYLNHLAQARNERIDMLAELDRRLTENRRELDGRQQRLDELAAELQGRSQQLAEQTRQRQAVLAELDQRYDTEASRLEALDQDRAHAERVLREVQESMASLDQPLPSTNIERTRGDLPWPVQGAMLSRFHQGRGVHRNGILIQAPAGTAVKAVHAGRVVFADWMRGFGNLLIIDHGDHVMTLYAHLQQFDVGVGSRIETGQSLGRVGDSGGRPSPGLYFEVRRGGDPINPQSWIARR
ncbi:murein hydrolase activator EnvC family protein [Halomonas cupida]|uniref:murein hydrolase activator EnvC family protein n=1 Tax=Halomonas cupida TaxID=44933 RepID=UPI003A958ED7